MPESPEQLAAYLADRDVLCPACRYNLRGVQLAMCPECAEPLDVVRLETSRRNTDEGRSTYGVDSLVLVLLAAISSLAGILGLMTAILGLFFSGKDPRLVLAAVIGAMLTLWPIGVERLHAWTVPVNGDARRGLISRRAVLVLGLMIAVPVLIMTMIGLLR